MVDVYLASKQQGKYPPLLLTLKWIIVLVYTTHNQKNYFLSVISQKMARNYSCKLLMCDFVSLAAKRWIVLAYHFWTSQSPCTKRTIHLWYKLKINIPIFFKKWGVQSSVCVRSVVCKSKAWFKVKKYL